MVVVVVLRPRGSQKKISWSGEVNTFNQLKPWNKGQHAVVVVGCWLLFVVCCLLIVVC